ncbi:hypothetical protein DIPPA_07551 [Diplonema papillatum]|nr:hypothetical protein DIPPA_07551 [Diplonema papillatum]
MHFRSWKEADATPRHLCDGALELAARGACEADLGLQIVAVLRAHVLPPAVAAVFCFGSEALETVLVSIAVSPALADLDDV